MKLFPLSSIVIVCAFGATNVQAFSMVRSGSTCERITSMAECEEAAGKLGLFDTSATTNDYSGGPPYCYYKTGEKRLYYNTNNNNPCTCERNCLCMPSAEECQIEENIQYWSTTNSDSNVGTGIDYADSASECKEHCETTYPAEAKYFTYHEEDANVKKKWRGSCRCKKDQGERREKNGVLSGNLNCGTPAEEPAVRWRSPNDYKCGSTNPLPNEPRYGCFVGQPSICNPSSHAPCCSSHGWCGNDTITGKEDDWCKKGGKDYSDTLVYKAHVKANP